MPALFAPALDLAALMAVLVVLALLVLAKGLAQSIHDGINVSVFGTHPFGNVARALENTIIAWVSDAIDATSGIARDLWHGLTWMLDEFLKGVNALATQTEQALSLLWGTSIPNMVGAWGTAIYRDIGKVRTALEDFGRVAAHDIAAATTKVDDLVRTLPTTIARYVDPAILTATTTLEAKITAAKTAAEQFANAAVATVQIAEAKAIGDAVTLAHEAKQAGLAAAAEVLTQAEAAAGGAELAAEATAAAALKASETAASLALGAVKSVAVNVEQDLQTIEGALTAAGLAALVASIPAIATLVHAIATEAGLEDAACRGKVKNICGTDPLKWENLLLGLAAVGFGFNLGEIVEAAAHGIGDARGLLAEVSNVPQDAIQRAGQAIGDVTRALAA